MPVKNFSIDNFKPDDSFFDDLREGKFVLVLGAGFSFEIPNKAGGIIPIGDQFALLTKNRFSDSSSKDYQSAAQVWRTQIRKDNSLLQELKNHFLVDEEKFDRKLYSLIFIPTWHNIYTLNFDNVLDIALKEVSTKRYLKFSYPLKTGGSYKPDIFHLHGVVENITNIDAELVFTPESYTNFDIEVPHDLYDVLHSDVREGKKILILGSQFKEPIILKKFFKTLPEDETIKIYQFDIENYNQHSDNFTKRDTTFVKLDKDKGGTKLFLEFLKDKRNVIEKIEIEGADLINNTFLEKVEKLGKEKEFKPADFYFAKQIDDCQWYGINKKWDTERKEYNSIKSETLKSFTVFDEPIVIAIILGRGGSGKSTLLRRLAIDLANEIFAVIWVNDKQINSFNEKGIAQISNYPHKQFLVIIEDWYRIKQNLKENATSVLNSLCSCTNVRVLVGDRSLDTNVKSNLNNPDKNQYQLKADDNEILIPKILDKIKDWKLTASELLKTPNDYLSSLYLILWTIGRTHLLKGLVVQRTIKHSNLKSHFQSIVRSDLKAIYKTAPGFAKVVYYWAKVYATNKVLIAFDIFEKIAEHLNGNDKTFNEYYSVDNKTKEILDVYINHSQSTIKLAKGLTFVAFNHDILAEEGLAESDFDKVEVQEKLICEPFSDGIKKQMLDIIIDKGDNFSVSNFLNYYLSTIHPKVISNEEKQKYIKAQIGKGNRGSYLNHIFYKNDIFDVTLKKEFAKIILSDFQNNHYHHSTISLCFKVFEGIPFAIQLLEKFKTEKIPFEIICNCLINLKDKPEGISYAIQLLERFKTEDVHHSIICNCLINLKDKPEGISYAIQLLEKFKTEKLDRQIISNCLINLKDKPEGISYATYFLKNKNWTNPSDWSYIFHSLNWFGSQANPPQFVVDIVNQILNDSGKGNNFRFSKIMNIPFHCIPQWKNKSITIIKGFAFKQRGLISNVLRSYRNHSDEISNVCKSILENWKIEILEIIPQGKNNKGEKEPHFGDHIKMALGHPDLKSIALKTAAEIVKAKEENMVTIPDYLFEIAEKIVNENIYPEWKINNNDEPNN